MLTILLLSGTAGASWDGSPSPTYVLGQPNFTSRSLHLTVYEGPLAEFLWNPLAVSGNGTGRLFIADTTNRRVVIHTGYVSSSFTPVDSYLRVLGQSHAYARTDFRAFPDARTIYAPSGLCSAPGTWPQQECLAVSDSAMHRVLVWTHPVYNDFEPADLVLGQPDFTTIAANSRGVSAGSLNGPLDVWTDGQRLAVADTYNHRVLLWDSLPAVLGQPADRVLGQADFASKAANRGGAVTAAGFSYPSSVYFDGQRLYVAEMLNHRVLVFDGWPAANGAPADRVLGQLDFVSNAANAGGTPTAQSLNGPRRVFADASGLYVADSINNRVLVWSNPAAASYSPADQVLGQLDFQSSAWATTADRYYYPAGIYKDAEYLYVADTANNRALCYYRDNTPPGRDITRWGTDASCTLAWVQKGGHTDVLRESAGPDPAGLFEPFGPSPWVRVQTDAVTDGNATFRVYYDPAGLTVDEEAELDLYVWDADAGSYADVAPGAADLGTRTVTSELYYEPGTGDFPLLVLGAKVRPAVNAEVRVWPPVWGATWGPAWRHAWYLVQVRVPEPYGPADVDGSSVTAAGAPARRHKVRRSSWWGLFPREAVAPAPEGATQLEIAVQGRFSDGRRFTGTGTVRVVTPPAGRVQAGKPAGLHGRRER